ncbi:group III truncated hemoglobin [Azoarcus sp. L1K30]|uniref:group III truncated hemoglobin n=1 Tax=Azoarcus sp. L1K30 TaxID=2820277 RepID=UPI001B83FAEB|nr:group III truncated hemoglobin [Azoarcus sp. L1K30]MBR0567095.1 group III truncated hemoglobin [Azoarcus sp. L1K30]
MAEPAELTEEMIAELVQVFYDRARLDDDLGPVFNNAVGDWDHHLGVVTDFWSNALLGTQRYAGHPFPVHMNLPIKREHFGQWLALFRDTAEEVLPPEAARLAIGRAEFMAKSFRAGLFPFDPVVPSSATRTKDAPG